MLSAGRHSPVFKYWHNRCFLPVWRNWSLIEQPVKNVDECLPVLLAEVRQLFVVYAIRFHCLFSRRFQCDLHFYWSTGSCASLRELALPLGLRRPSLPFVGLGCGFLCAFAVFRFGLCRSVPVSFVDSVATWLLGLLQPISQLVICQNLLLFLCTGCLAGWGSLVLIWRE